ncbi:unnamed protein product, partial [Mesorhabditis belari]|uniref:Uncharacterized protein n=1 Tax=Mesorhabditis belari TaxID=2138241 RepID=A0AAF3F797_9BILA
MVYGQQLNQAFTRFNSFCHEKTNRIRESFSPSRPASNQSDRSSTSGTSTLLDPEETKVVSVTWMTVVP